MSENNSVEAMSIERISKKIIMEVGCESEMAERMAVQLAEIHENLKPIVSAWLLDELVGFEYNGITLNTIMEKERVTYVQAIFSMSTILNDPEFAEMYLEFEFDTDYLGG